MADIDNIISQEALGQVGQLNASFEKSVVLLDKIIQQSTALDARFSKQATSQQQVNIATKEAKEINVSLLKAEDEIVKTKLRLARVNKEQRDHLKAITVLEDKEAGTLEKLRAKNALLRQEKEKLNLATREGIKRQREINKELDNNNKIIKQNADGLVKQKMSIGGYTKSILQAAGIVTGATAVMAAFFRVIKNGFSTTIGFEKEMSRVKAISRATQEEFEALRGQAILLGGSTKYTASEVAGLQVEYAKLGFIPSQIKSITAATLSLAAATDENLAETANIVGATIRQFGLSVGESQRVVDVMAMSFNASALDLEKFATAMANAGPVAASVGEDIEKTTAKISVLANTGLDASTAGTSLRNMYLELQKTGLTWDQAMQKIAASQNQAATSFDLFGKRGAVAGVILATNSEEAATLEEAYRHAGGAAAETARIMQENVAGSVVKLQSAWEGLTLRINNSSGALKYFIDSLGVMISGVATKGSQNMQELFDDKQINTFNDRFQFFIALGVGYNKAAKMARKNTNEETQKLKDEFVALGKIRDQKEKEREDAAYKATEAERLRKEEELRAIQEEIDKREEAAKRQKELQKEIAKGEAERTKNLEKHVEEATKDNKRVEVRIGLAKEETQTLVDLDSMQVASEEEKQAAIDALREAGWNKTKEQLQEEMEMREEMHQLQMELLNGAFDLNAAFIARKSSKLEAAYDREIKAAGDNEEAKEKIDEKYDKKRKELQRKQAVADKIQALFNIGIDVAKGIASALAKTVTIPLIPWIAALGAVQAATVLATPLPQYAKGTMSSKGGPAIVGEKGRELMIDPSGRMSLTGSEAHLTMLKPGTKIIPSDETSAIMRAAAISKRSTIEDTIKSGNRDIVEAIRRQRIEIAATTGRSITVREGNQWREYFGRHLQ